LRNALAQAAATLGSRSSHDWIANTRRSICARGLEGVGRPLVLGSAITAEQAEYSTVPALTAHLHFLTPGPLTQTHRAPRPRLAHAREAEIPRFLADGRSNAPIARSLQPDDQWPHRRHRTLEHVRAPRRSDPSPTPVGARRRLAGWPLALVGALQPLYHGRRRASSPPPALPGGYPVDGHISRRTREPRPVSEGDDPLSSGLSV
jgi:hypothetical protein